MPLRPGLRRAGENRPVSLCVRRKGKKKEKDRSQSHEVDAVYRIAQFRSQLGFTTVFLQQRLETRIAPQADPKSDSLSDLPR